MMFSIETVKKHFNSFSFIGARLAKAYPTLKYTLKEAEINIDVNLFLASAFISSIIYTICAFALSFSLFFLKTKMISPQNIVLSVLIGLAFGIVFFMLQNIAPKMLVSETAKQIDNDLIFAVRTLIIVLSSGVSLYEAIAHIAKSGNNIVSKEFSIVVKKINSGMPELEAIEELALHTKSDFMKKTAWQIVNAIKSGASVTDALKTILETLTNYQIRTIKEYAGELNLCILMYLILAAALPTIGIVIMIVFTTISGGGMGLLQIFGILAFSIVIQIFLIGFVKTRIPKIFTQ